MPFIAHIDARGERETRVVMDDAALAGLVARVVKDPFTEISIEPAYECGNCDGKGRNTGWPHTTCPTCGGSGVDLEAHGLPKSAHDCSSCGASPQECERKRLEHFRRGIEKPCCGRCKITDTHGGFDFRTLIRPNNAEPVHNVLNQVIEDPDTPDPLTVLVSALADLLGGWNTTEWTKRTPHAVSKQVQRVLEDFLSD